MTNEQIKCPTCKGEKKIVKIAVVKDPSPVDYCDGQGYEIPCPDCCAKPDEQINCPVIKSCKACGNYSKKGDWRICRLLNKAVDGSGINYLAERLPDCPFTMEKAAAVKEERERVIKLALGKVQEQRDELMDYARFIKTISKEKYNRILASCEEIEKTKQLLRDIK